MSACLGLLPFGLAFSRARIAESFGKGIVIDLELGDLLVLVGGDGDELGLLEDVRAEGCHWYLLNVVAPDQMESGSILVHRVEHGLK